MSVIFLIVLSAITFIAFAFFKAKKIIRLGLGVISLVFLSIAIASCLITVPAGHVKVASLFGKVQDNPYGEGLHLVNPFFTFNTFDLRQKTIKETAGIPSEDKLITGMDVSVQYRTIGTMTPDILRNTGSTEALLEVHLIPKLRSILREQGKGIPQAQDFFKEQVQSQLQNSLQAGLSEYLASKGIQVDAVLIRDVVLPKVIRDSIEATKDREQKQVLQQAELQRFATEQEQKVKQAEAEFDAAKLEAEKIKALADAEAYKINVINTTLAKSPNYIELKRVEQWNGKLPLYAGGDNIPMIDLRGAIQ